jgi:hypothetical protein
MDGAEDRAQTIAQLERDARSGGSFVDRAIVREIKIAAGRFSEQESLWLQVAALIERWREGAPDVEVLESVRRINRIATCWKDGSASATPESTL